MRNRKTESNRDLHIRRKRALHHVGPMMLLAVGMLIPSMGPSCLEESEPNDNANQANLIRAGESGAGAINAIGDRDVWVTHGVNAGELIFAAIDASGDDSFLEVFANNTTSLVDSDDNSGPGLSSVIAGTNVTQTGSLFYRVSEDNDDDVVASYNLFQAILHPADTAWESGANGNAMTANGISASITSAAVSGADLDFFAFRAAAGASMYVIMDDDPDRNGDFTDTGLAILGTNGIDVLATGDNNSGNRGNAAGVVSAPTTGTYYVRVEDGGAGADTDYRFVVFVNGVPYIDSDGDLMADTDDNCPALANAGQVDTDGDGVGNACDACVLSILKTTGPGDCGCDEPDIDIDGDGVSDCGLADPARSLLFGHGLILSADADNHRIMAFDPADGDLVDPDFIPPDAANLPNPVSAILGPNQNTILVSDNTLDAIQEFDFDGNFLGIFAPAGGVDTTILASPAALAWHPNGHLVVGVTNGPNSDAVAEFDASGNFVGNFIANGDNGLSDPRDVLFHSSGRVLVVDGTNTILEFDLSGTFVADFANISQSTLFQITEASNTNVRIAASLSDRRGIVSHNAAGTFLDQNAPAAICNFIGVAELANGNLLVTGQPLSTDVFEGIVFEMDVGGNVVRTHLRGPNLTTLEHVLVDGDGDGVGDALDPCPNDPEKISPGACGCGLSDKDSDGDGIVDCDDACPDDALNDSDGDGVCDSVDVCPGADDTVDNDGDGTPDCLDAPPPPPPPPPGDEGEPADVPMTGECCGGGLPALIPFMLLGWGRMRRARRKR